MKFVQMLMFCLMCLSGLQAEVAAKAQDNELEHQAARLEEHHKICKDQAADAYFYGQLGQLAPAGLREYFSKRRAQAAKALESCTPQQAHPVLTSPKE